MSEDGLRRNCRYNFDYGSETCLSATLETGTYRGAVILQPAELHLAVCFNVNESRRHVGDTMTDKKYWTLLATEDGDSMFDMCWRTSKR